MVCVVTCFAVVSYALVQGQNPVVKKATAQQGAPLPTPKPTSTATPSAKTEKRTATLPSSECPSLISPDYLVAVKLDPNNVEARKIFENAMTRLSRN
jgi:hypothetical protein